MNQVEILESGIKIPTIFPYITDHVRLKPLFGKQESLELRQESWNQAKIPEDSRITSIKIQSCGPSMQPYSCNAAWYSVHVTIAMVQCTCNYCYGTVYM